MRCPYAIMTRMIMRLILIFAVTIVILKISTFGWWISTVKNLFKDKVLADKLKDHVHVLSQEIGKRDIFEYKNLSKAADHIADEFRKFGYEVTFQEYAVWNKTVRNIIAVKKGSQYPEDVLIVGAHYDTCNNPGADDNASGIACLLELARACSKADFKRTIEFVAFVNEEPPFCRTENMGSLVFTRQAKSENKNIKGVVVLESLGYYSNKIFSQRYPPLLGLFYPNKGNYVAVVGNFRSRHLVGQVREAFKRKAAFPIRSLTVAIIDAASFSDHWSFWQEGYPAVMITDTAFLRNPNYHRNTDTFETLNYEYMVDILTGLQSAVNELAPVSL